MIASSNLSPPTRTEPLYTTPPSEITPTSVVPPPTSTTIEPVASATGRSAPIAAAIGSSIRNTWPAPAPIADSRIARRSTCVEPQGTQMMMRGAGREEFGVVHFLDEVLQHLLGDGEVGDHAVLHRADRDDVAGRLAEHHLGFLARPPGWISCAFGPPVLADRDHRRLVEHDALAAHVDQRVGGAEIDRQIVGKITAQKSEHGRGESSSVCP